MKKVKVTQDVLYRYILEHNVNISGLAREMDANASFVIACFKHNPDRLGKPRRFTSATLPRLNEALGTFALKMRRSTITFGSEQTYTNRFKNTYDPGTMPAIKQLAQYFNITSFIVRVLGWTRNKKNAIFSNPSSITYGNISQDDVNRINAELLAVAGVLSSYEVVSC